jgi:hypothetical protein
MKVIWRIICIVCFTQMLPAQPVCNICNYGAKGDGQSLKIK